MLQEALVTASTARLRGNAHAAAGRLAAAELQWREAIKTFDRLLEVTPDSGGLREQKATVLARLGEHEAAAAEYALAHELKGSPAVGSVEWAGSYEYHVAAGDHEGAIVRLDRLMQHDYGRWPGVDSHLRYDPTMRSLHRDPRVKAMLERGARWLEEKRSE